MGNVLPLRPIRNANLTPQNSVNVNSARVQSAIICETNNGINYADRIESAESTQAWMEFAISCKNVGKFVKLASGGARIGDQIYMTQRMIDLKSEFTDKAEEFKELGGDLMEFGKETGLKIGNVFKVAEEFYKTANSFQLDATKVRGDAHTVANEKQSIASQAFGKFDEAIALRDRANDMKNEAKFTLDKAYAETNIPANVKLTAISVAKTNYTNANKYYGEKNQQALQAQGVAETARANYLNAIALENVAIDKLNSANEQLYTSAQNYQDSKAEVDAYNLQVQAKLKNFNKAKEELQGIMHEIRNEQVSANKRLALYAVGGQSGVMADAIGDGINHAVAGNGCQAIGSIVKGGLQPFTEAVLAEASPYVPLAMDAVDAVAYTGDTGDVKTALWNFGDTVLGIGLMMQNVKDIGNFYDALDADDYVTAISLSGRSLVGSWNFGVKNVGTAVSLATGIPFAQKGIGVAGLIASDIIAMPFMLGLTIESLGSANVAPDVMAEIAGKTMLGSIGLMLTDVIAIADGGKLKAKLNDEIGKWVGDSLEGSGVAMENGVPIVARDNFGLNSFIFYPDPKKQVENPNLRQHGANNMGLGGIRDAFYKTSGSYQFNWWLSMGYDACGGELKPCPPDYFADVNKSIQDQEAHNAFMLDCSKKQNAWITPFNITDYEGASRCGMLYNQAGIWAMNGCNTANTPVKSLADLKKYLKPVNFSDINLRNGDQVDTVYGGESVTP